MARWRRLTATTCSCSAAARPAACSREAEREPGPHRLPRRGRAGLRAPLRGALAGRHPRPALARARVAPLGARRGGGSLAVACADPRRLLRAQRVRAAGGRAVRLRLGRGVVVRSVRAVSRRANETLRGHVLADEELTPWHRAFR